MDSALAFRRKEMLATLSASGRFGRFRPETEQLVRSPVISSDAELEALKSVWASISASAIYPENSSYSPFSSSGVFKRLMERCCTAGLISRFSIALANFQQESEFTDKAGYFISALVTGSRDWRFTIHTSHLSVPPDSIGFFNEKMVEVRGDAGHFVGSDMVCGAVTVDGDCGIHAGAGMSGGTLIIKGSTFFALGINMTGGTIIIEGDAGSIVGDCMSGGTIHLEGSFRSLADTERMSGGRIFHKGRLLFEK
jgi:hypothetical protein